MDVVYQNCTACGKYRRIDKFSGVAGSICVTCRSSAPRSIYAHTGAPTTEPKPTKPDHPPGWITLQLDRAAVAQMIRSTLGTAVPDTCVIEGDGRSLKVSWQQEST